MAAPTRRSRRLLAAALLHVALALATAATLGVLELRRTHTLQRNGRWISSKIDVHYGILGAVSYVTTRTSLHRNRLDLSAWHGSQELLYREPVELEALELRLRLGESGYVIALFDKTEKGFWGVRLSSDPQFPSACLAGTDLGEFTHREPLQLAPLDDRWHQLALRAAGGGYAVSLDGREIGRCGMRTGRSGRVGVRGSAAKQLWVDDVVIRPAGGTPLVERFDNRRGAGQAFGLALLLVAALHGIVQLAGRRRGRAGLRAGATHLALLASAGLALALDTFVLGGRHPRRVDFRGYPNRIETEPDVRARLREIPRHKPPGVRRILLVGGSQTWGSGARAPQGTWFALLERRLNDGAPAGTRYECISAGIPAWDVPRLVELYESEWLELQPDVVVVNAGHNDRDPARFREGLERFAWLGRARGIHTVFVPEPNTTESRRGMGRLLGLHAVMREVARGQGVALIDVHEYLEAHRGDGFLWWDRVHLAPFGHELFARRLYEQRAALLGERPRRAPMELDQNAARQGAPARG